MCILPTFEDVPSFTQHTHLSFKDISISGFKEVLEDVCQQQTAKISREGPKLFFFSQTVEHGTIASQNCKNWSYMYISYIKGIYLECSNFATFKCYYCMCMVLFMVFRTAFTSNHWIFFVFVSSVPNVRVAQTPEPKTPSDFLQCELRWSFSNYSTTQTNITK